MDVTFEDSPVLQDYWKHTRLRQLRELIRASSTGGVGLWCCQGCGELRMMKTYPYTKIGKQIFDNCLQQGRSRRFKLEYKLTAEDIVKIRRWYHQLKDMPRPSNI